VQILSIHAGRSESSRERPSQIKSLQSRVHCVRRVHYWDGRAFSWTHWTRRTQDSQLVSRRPTVFAVRRRPCLARSRRWTALLAGRTGRAGREISNFLAGRSAVLEPDAYLFGHCYRRTDPAASCSTVKAGCWLGKWRSPRSAVCDYVVRVVRLVRQPDRKVGPADDTDASDDNFPRSRFLGRRFSAVVAAWNSAMDSGPRTIFMKNGPSP
jgi:hypothetical protein